MYIKYLNKWIWIPNALFKQLAKYDGCTTHGDNVAYVFDEWQSFIIYYGKTNDYQT